MRGFGCSGCRGEGFTAFSKVSLRAVGALGFRLFRASEFPGAAWGFRALGLKLGWWPLGHKHVWFLYSLFEGQKRVSGVSVRLSRGFN